MAVLEFPYLRDLVRKCEFDTIYHEHLCYFSVTALIPLFERHGLHLNDVRPLATLPGVLAIAPVAGNGAKPGSYELRLRESADPQAVLASCFERGIRLKRFDHSDPTLHEVFVNLVGPEAREASFR